ncbi:hypothetical protein NBM05_08595 [Rothia sp. AR01]|uniref:Uncharacterized protein n=1 Tax=Rothia santali TaxID=2949643 RepID=A0A9X2HD29_9MICC|nr:hypothetical protein [Rothia santali]MCP3426060.1 hypothetical protein [Rothia santali]
MARRLAEEGDRVVVVGRRREPWAGGPPGTG